MVGKCFLKVEGKKDPSEQKQVGLGGAGNQNTSCYEHQINVTKSFSSQNKSKCLTEEDPVKTCGTSILNNCSHSLSFLPSICL